MEIPLTYTVTMDANIARKVGVPAAMLYNLIVWLAQTDMAKSYDEDGWIYLSAKEFESKTTFNANTFTAAGNKLVAFGLVEKKKMFIKNSIKPTTHFRLLSRFYGNDVTSNVNNVITSNVKTYKEDNNKEEIHRFPASASPSLETKEPGELVNERAAHALTMEEKDEPFSEPIVSSHDSVSIKPNEVRRGCATPAEVRRRRSFAVLSELYKRYKWRGRPTPTEAKLIAAALDNGWTKEEMVQMVEWQNQDEFYQTLSVAGRFSDQAFKKYDAVRTNGSNKALPKGVW